MELTPLRYFIAIARAQHMTRAARALGITQPALSATVKKLEVEAGAPLLHRTARGVELTEAGRIFLRHAEEALHRVEAGVRAVRELVGLEQGSIRVGGGATAMAFLLPPVVSALRKQHPGLRYYLREAGSAAVADAVLSGELDLGLVTLPVKHADAAALHQVAIVEDELRLILPRKHPLAGRKTFAWSDLRAESVVAFEAGSAVREVIDAAAQAAAAPLNVVMELRSIESIRRMVAAGVGVGFVSRFALSPGEGLACRDGRLVRHLAVIRGRGREPSAAAAAFEHALRAQLQPRG